MVNMPRMVRANITLIFFIVISICSERIKEINIPFESVKLGRADGVTLT